MPTVHQDAVNTWKQSFTLCYVLIFVLFCFVFVDDVESHWSKYRNFNFFHLVFMGYTKS